MPYLKNLHCHHLSGICLQAIIAYPALQQNLGSHILKDDREGKKSCDTTADNTNREYKSSSHYAWSHNTVRELDISGIAHYKFVPTGQTVNQVCYLEVLKRLRENVRRKRPELLPKLMDLASRHFTCSHSTVCEGVFS